MDYSGAETEYRATAFEVKAVDRRQRIIAGFAAYHSNLDRVQDIIDPQASAKAVAGLDLKRVGVFVGHKTDRLSVGRPLRIEAQPQGLYTETLIRPGPSGDDVLAAAEFEHQSGSALGMSIGYRVRAHKYERGPEGKSIRRILDYQLVEYSYCDRNTTANPEAVTLGVKQADARWEAPPADYPDLGAFYAATEAVP